jgi:hypothetical protein
MTEGMYRAEVDDPFDSLSPGRTDKCDTAFSIGPDAFLILPADADACCKMKDNFTTSAKISQIGFTVDVTSDYFNVEILQTQRAAMNQGFNTKPLANQHPAKVCAYMA